MHQLIMGFPEETDHIDHDRLNNQKSNLRAVTKQHNLINRGKQRNSNSPYKGVHLRKHLKSKPWQASITKTENGKRRTFFIGYFATAKEAAQRYDAKAIELFGQFAFLNFPKT